MTLLDRYLMRTVLMHTLMVLAVLLALMTLVIQTTPMAIVNRSRLRSAVEDPP